MITVKFTDAHGLTHDAAIARIKRAACNATSTLELNNNDGALQAHQSQHRNINYEIEYWPSQQHKDNGNEPLSFIQQHDGYTSSDISFDSDSDADIETQSALESAVIEHFKTVAV